MRANKLLHFFVSGSSSSLSYNSHKAEYYELNNNIIGLLKLYQTLNVSDSFNDCVNVEIPFVPSGIRLGASSSDVVAQLGKAKYSISKNIGKGHSVLFYRQNIKGINILTQVHLFDNIVVYVKVSFDYLEASKGARSSIYHSLKSKYELDIDVNKDNYYIDVNNNYLKVIDNGQINVQFFYNNNEIINDIKSNLTDTVSGKGNSEDLIKDLI